MTETTINASAALMATGTGATLTGCFEARRPSGGTSQAVGSGESVDDIGTIEGMGKRWRRKSEGDGLCAVA
mgnify:CR=1 FL=1